MNLNRNNFLTFSVPQSSIHGKVFWFLLIFSGKYQQEKSAGTHFPIEGNLVIIKHQGRHIINYEDRDSAGCP